MPPCGFVLFLVFGLRLGISAEERNGLTYPFWGFGFWVALFSVFPCYMGSPKEGITRQAYVAAGVSCEYIPR
jgi:hypothetical protein